MKKLILYVLFTLLISSVCNAALLKGSVFDISLEKKPNVIVSVDTNPKQAIIANDGDYEFALSPGNYTIKADYYENQLIGLTAESSILIENDKGLYKLDLVLLPEIDVNDSTINIDPYDPFFDETSEYGKYGMFFFIIILSVSSYFIYKKFKKSDKNENIEKKKEEKNVKDDKIVYSVNNTEMPRVSVNYTNTDTEIVESESKDKDTNISEKEKQIIKPSFHEQLVKEVIEFIESQGGSTTQKDIRKKFTSSEAKISLVITELAHKDRIEKIKKGRGNIIVLKSGDKDKVHKEHS